MRPLRANRKKSFKLTLIPVKGGKYYCSRRCKRVVRVRDRARKVRV